MQWSYASHREEVDPPFLTNALLLQHFCMKQQGCSLGAAMSLLIKFTISQLYQYYLSFLYHTDISFIYLYDITAISILSIFALSQHPFPVNFQKLHSSHHQSVQWNCVYFKMKSSWLSGNRKYNFVLLKKNINDTYNKKFLFTGRNQRSQGKMS